MDNINLENRNMTFETVMYFFNLCHYEIIENNKIQINDLITNIYNKEYNDVKSLYDFDNIEDI